MLDDILTDYRNQLATIPLWDGRAIVTWLEQVSFWLARLKVEEDYKLWALKMATGLHLKGGQPLNVCLGVLQGQVTKCLLEGGVAR